MEFTWFSFLISTLITHMQHSVTSSSGRPHRHRVMHRVSKFSLASERLSPGNRDLSHILRAASWPNVGSCPRREEGMPVGTRPWPITTHHTEDIHMLSGCRCGCNGASFPRPPTTLPERQRFPCAASFDAPMPGRGAGRPRSSRRGLQHVLLSPKHATGGARWLPRCPLAGWGTP